MRYTIYQVKHNNPDGRMFMNNDWLVKNGLRVHVSAYDCTYSGESVCPNGIDEFLEYLFARFNTRRPSGFKGHSMSVSDVVVLEEGGIKKAFFCDSSGWRKAPDFLNPDIRPLQTVDIHVCPNHCGALLATAVHIVQTWKVDALGNFVEEISPDGVAHGPDSDSTWECTECGAEAEEIKCRRVEISTWEAYGSVFIPTVPRGCVFWQAQGDTAIKYVPIQPDEREAPTVTIDGQLFYLADL